MNKFDFKCENCGDIHFSSLKKSVVGSVRTDDVAALNVIAAFVL